MTSTLTGPELKNLDSEFPMESFWNGLKEVHPNMYCKVDIEIDSTKDQVVVLTGPSGGGKDSVFCPLMENGEVRHVVTATSRPRRINSNEPEGAYVWMRARREDESQEQYVENLVKEYQLVEYDVHYGNVYGLPLASLRSNIPGVPVIRTDIHGVQILLQVLPAHGFQPISVAIMPDSWNQIYTSILNRGGENEEKALSRLKEDYETRGLYQRLIHYYLHNTRNADPSGISGLDISISAFRFLIEKIRQK